MRVETMYNVVLGMLQDGCHGFLGNHYSNGQFLPSNGLFLPISPRVIDQFS